MSDLTFEETYAAEMFVRIARGKHYFIEPVQVEIFTAFNFNFVLA